MSDMRNFEPSNDIRAESAFVDSGEIEVKESYKLDESSSLGEFHQPVEEEEGSGRSKVISALIVALMVGAAGAYAYSMYTPQRDMVADENLPQTNAPKAAAVTPMAPPPAATPAGDALATSPTDTAMSAPTRPETAMTAPTAPDVVKPAARTTQQRVANAPRVTPLPESSAVTPAPSPATIAPPQNQAAAVPEPVSPTPPASAVAGNPPLNEQSVPAEPTPVTPTAPADAAPAQPEPAQPQAPAPAQ